MKKILTILLAMVFIFGCGRKEIYVPEEFSDSNPNMLFTFAELMHGKAMIIELPSGETLLVDCGGTEDFPKLYDSLRQMEMARLDYVILTSVGDDITVALQKLSANIEIGDIYISQHISDISDFKKICRNNPNPECSLYLVSEGTRLYDYEGVSIDVVYSGMYDTKNGTRPVISLYISYGDISVFYEGDGDYIAEREIVSTMNNLVKSDVLVVPHCGKEYLPGDELINAVNPDYAVIPVYGDIYPLDSTLKRLTENGCEILRTDYDGKISFVTDGQNIDVYKER